MRSGETPASRSRRPRAVLGVHHYRVDRPQQAPRGRRLPGPRLPREHVVRGEHERGPAGQQEAVERRQGEPLEVREVGVPSGATPREHVGHVLGEPERPAPARPAGGPPVEGLAHEVSRARGHGTEAEAARPQLDVHPRAASAAHSAWS